MKLNSSKMKKDYSRRDFIKHNSLAGLGLISMGSIAGCAVSKSGSSSLASKNEKITRIGNLTPEQLREKYRAALFDRFIPNMDKLVIDHEYGGFMCNVNIATQKLLNGGKRAWYEGRGIWAYSFLYNNFGKDPKFLEVARKSKDFIMKHQPKDNSFWIGAFTREGAPVGGPGDIYGSLFVAEGLTEFSKATGDRQYLEQAKKITLSALARYDSPDYSHEKLIGPRINGHWMIFLRSATQFLELQSDPDIQKLADRCLDAIMKHHLNPDFGLINENLNHDFSRTPEQAQFSYTGHGIETLWMVMAEAVRRKDAALFNTAAKAFKHNVTVAKDNVYGGYFRSLDHIDNNTWTVNKVRWLQEEVLNGSLLLAEHTGDQWALDCFAETDAYTTEKFHRPEYAFVIDSGDRKVDKHSQVRAENYHHPRELMLTLLALDRIISRGHKPSGIFG
jgi:N-acylglucosamine 2-epimerase